MFNSKQSTCCDTDHLHTEGEDEVQLNPERQGAHMHAEEGEHQV